MIHDFNTSLEKGRLGEEKIKTMLTEDFYPYLCRPEVLDCVFKDYPILQRNGIDLIFKLPQIKIEVKTRDTCFYYKHDLDILLETISVVEENKKGWLFTSTSDIVLYLWWADKSKQKFRDGYILFMDQLKQTALEKSWVIKYKKKKKIARTYTNIYDCGYYKTESIVVPVHDLLPLKLIVPIKKDYNDILKKWFVQDDNKQKELDDLTKGWIIN